MSLGLDAMAVEMFARPMQRIRAGGDYNSHGTFEPTEEIAVIRAVVQASSQNDLRTLPEGERTDGYVTIWTVFDLQTTDEGRKTLADVIRTPEGQDYKIVKVGPRHEGQFTRAIGRLEYDRGRSL